MSNPLKSKNGGFEKTRTKEEKKKQILAIIRTLKNPPNFHIPEQDELKKLEEKMKQGESVNMERIEELKEIIFEKKREYGCDIAKKMPRYKELNGKVAIDKLIKETGCEYLSAYVLDEMQPKNPIEKMLIDQLVLLHAHCIKNIVNCPDSPSFGYDNFNKVLNTSARMMDIFQKGALALHKLRNGGEQTVTVKHQHVHISEGGQAVIADEFKHDKGGI